MVATRATAAAAATARQAVEHASAPETPRLLIERKTETTMRLSGTPKMLTITLRWLSGTYLERRVPMEGKYMPTHASKTRKDAITATRDDPMAVATPMATVAAVSIPAHVFSTAKPLLARAPKRVLPRRHDAMKHENTFPKGTAPPATTAMSEGAHWSTKMYMAPSKSDCTVPTSRIFLSASITWNASEMVGPLDSAELMGETFSFHWNMAISAPMARNTTEISKGPQGPRAAAATPASCPAEMATRLSPAYASPNVWPSHLPSKPPLECSPTSHDSGAEKRRLVPMPPARRPSMSTQRRDDLVLSAPMV
mmetsp:Transcript_55130/g.130853  ORF Transcript_55130/g.130853 Transcript_55130/m.130853 type:complete len:310 (-) Transcript_55130:701-1630(-)